MSLEIELLCVLYMTLLNRVNTFYRRIVLYKKGGIKFPAGLGVIKGVSVIDEFTPRYLTSSLIVFLISLYPRDLSSLL